MSVTVDDDLAKTARSSSATVWLPRAATSLTLILDTRTFAGSAASRSAKSLDHEKRFRSTRVCAAARVCCWSEVKDALISVALSRNSRSSWLRLLISSWIELAFALACAVDRAMNARKAKERKAIATATVHGNARLVYGLLARLS